MNDKTGPVHWHAMDADEVLMRLDASCDGLTREQAGLRISKSHDLLRRVDDWDLHR
jgi:hypothetical protein